jgi:hypothetical protein
MIGDREQSGASMIYLALQPVPYNLEPIQVTAEERSFDRLLFPSGVFDTGPSANVPESFELATACRSERECAKMFRG